MKLLWILLCSCTLVLSEGIHQKLVVFTDKNGKNAQENLLKLKVHFIENQNIRAINEKNNLRLELETLGVYTMVVVKPIVSRVVKNRLLMELTPIFPDVFALEYTTANQTENDPVSAMPVKQHLVKENSIKVFMERIGPQWISLLILATAGLILSIFRRRRVLLLDKNQKALDRDQKEIEKEIKNLGTSDA